MSDGKIEEGVDNIEKRTVDLEESFAQILDAAKHQDDQIGRLLVAVAFLTAAILTLASLNSAAFVTRDFYVPPFVLPLALIATITFLVGMAIAVLLLLAALTAPYGLPGVTLPHDPLEVDPKRNGAGVPCSHIYFLQISSLSNEEWRQKWRSPVNEIRKEHFASLVEETHSLSVRTAFQYERSSEATTVLSFSFLFFSLAMILVGIAARGNIKNPVHLELYSRILLGVILGTYFSIQLGTPMRRSYQTVGSDQRSSPLRIIFVMLISTLVAGAAIFARPWQVQIWISAMSVLTLLSLYVYWKISEPSFWAARVVVMALLFSIVSGVIVCGVQGYYAGQLLAIACGAALLTTLSLISPTYALYIRWRNYGQRMKRTN